MIWTLDEAKQHLNAWKAADLALATGKEYWFDGRKLTRADAREVAERIRYFSGVIQRLNGRGRYRRVVPYD
jgi:hypothetical protein